MTIQELWDQNVQRWSNWEISPAYDKDGQRGVRVAIELYGAGSSREYLFGRTLEEALLKLREFLDKGW